MSPSMPKSVAVAEENPAAVEVVRADFDEHAVIRQDLDVVLPYLPADMRQHLVPVLEFHSEGGVAKTLDDGALKLDAAVSFDHAQYSVRCRPGERTSTQHQLQIAARTPGADTFEQRDRRTVGLVDVCRCGRDPAPVGRAQHLGQQRPSDTWRRWSERTAIRPIRGCRGSGATRTNPTY